MSNIQANAIVKARRELSAAKAEYQRALTHEVKSYRGVATLERSIEPQEVHGTFTYRGLKYTK